MAAGPKNIDEYLKGVSVDRRAALEKLRRQILRAAPLARECISYSMPAFRVEAGVVAGFLATKKGCSYFPFSGTTLDGLGAALSAYSRTKSALHFTPERGLPASLVTQLVKARLAEMGSVSRPSKQQVAKKKKAVRRGQR